MKGVDNPFHRTVSLPQTLPITRLKPGVNENLDLPSCAKHQPMAARQINTHEGRRLEVVFTLKVAGQSVLNGQ